MGTNGLLIDVRWEWTGTEVTTDLLTGETVLPVLDPESITADENVWIANTGPYVIVDMDVDASTFTIEPGLLLDIDRGTEVSKDIGGQPGRAWVAEVILPDAERPVEVPLTIHDLAVMPEGTYDPPVVIVLSDDLDRVENLPGSLPVVDGSYVDPDGLPPSPPVYTWIKYADSPTTGMNDDPTGKAYMGLSFNNLDPTESTDYADYDWSLIQGEPGIPGEPGEDGSPTYTWIRYADDAAGTGMSDAPAGKEFIGIASNKPTEVESSDPADYTWALFQGPQGDQGIPGEPGADGVTTYTWVKYATTPTTGMSDDPTGKPYIGFAFNKTTAVESSTYGDYSWSLIEGPQGDEGVEGPPGADGQPTYTWIKYATNATGTTGFSDSPTGATYLGLAHNKTTAVESSDPADYTWALFQGPQGEEGIPGPPGADGQPTYTWIKYATTPTTGMSDDPTGKPYIGIAPNKTTATESSTYGDYTWSLIQGPQGDQGIEGPPGDDGLPTYTWVKYGTSAAGAGLSDDPTGKTYIGLAYNKTTEVESTTPGDYQWALFQGPQGVPGPPGDEGPPGTPPTDGDPPSSSPTPEVIPGIGAFFLRWTPPSNPDPMRFEVHVSATGTGFTPDSTTLYSETPAYSMTVRHLPQIDTETGEPIPFAYDTPYYFKIVAKDDDPGTAPASTGVSAIMTKITGPDIAATTIRGENIIGSTLTGDLFSSELTLGSTITTGALDDSTDPPTIVGARVELGPAGLRVVDTDGNDVFFVPLSALDSAFIRANFDMLSATVQDDFTMYGERNQIAVGSAMALSNGVTPPTGTPTVSWLYDTVQLDTQTAVPPHTPNTGYNLGTFKLDPSQITSMAWNSVWSAWEVVQQKSGGFRLWRFNSSGGIYSNFATGRPWVDDYNDRTLCTNAFGTGSGAQSGGAVLFKSGGEWYFFGPTQINRIPPSWILDVAGRPPCLGYDTINGRWVIAQSDGGGSGTFHVRRFTVNTYSGSGAFPNATSDGTYVAEAGSGLGKRTNGVYIGPGDFGSNRYLHSVDDYYTAYVFTTAGVLRDDEGSYELWAKAEPSLGFAFDGTQFGSVGATGKITKYTTWNWTSINTKSWLGLTAYDSDTAGVSSGTSAPHSGQTAGQHETPVGTIFEFSMQRRSKLNITVPKTQDSGGVDDPDKWKVYWSRQTTKPTLASHFKYAGQAGSPSALTTLPTITSDPTGVVPPGGIAGTVGAVNNFPGGVPASLFSSATDGLGELIKLKGDGSWRLGHLAGTAAGTDANDTGWVALTLTNGYTNYGGAYTTAACRRIGKQVFLRGLPNGGTKGTPIATLPVGFRPPFQMLIPAVVQSISINATGDGSKNTGNPDDNVTAAQSAGTAHTHGMKNHQHPISAYDISTTQTNAVARLTLFTDGTLVGETGTMDDTSWVSLFGISFLLD